MPSVLPLTYVVPLRTAADADIDDLASYLTRLSHAVDQVLVVDGSAPEVVAGRRARVGDTVEVLVPDHSTLNGKVANVDTGLRNARNEWVVLADDDVRYEIEQLAAVSSRLAAADVVRPQNYFSSWPWHARFDGARSLLNRMSGGDWPGTLAIRRSTYLRAGGYAGDVLFENFELVRTLLRAGGREACALDLFVARRPPTARHFRGQQIRQAYDEFARPARLCVFLAVLPLTLQAALRRRMRVVATAALAVIAVAEAGRRRAGGAARVPGFLRARRTGMAALAVSLFLGSRGGARPRRGPVRRPPHRAGRVPREPDVPAGP